MIDRAPRKKKRLSCEILFNDSRYSGIVVDVSASGMFIQTNAKPTPGETVEVRVTVPGADEPAVMTARVARKKIVPPELLTLAQGGVGLAFTETADSYLDFVAEISAEHAEAVAQIRARKATARAKGGSAKAGSAKSGNGTGARAGGGAGGGRAISRFRIHAVETATGKKNSFLVNCASEQEAEDEVTKQLGDDWQVLFIERA